MSTPEELLAAVRQYKHNDGSEGFVFGYDEKETNRQFALIKSEGLNRLQLLKLINHKLDDLNEQKKITSVLKLIQSDPHQWSSRGCQTCQAITDLAGQKFGCNLYRQINA